jgi:hypothetical protein
LYSASQVILDDGAASEVVSCESLRQFRRTLTNPLEYQPAAPPIDASAIGCRSARDLVNVVVNAMGSIIGVGLETA